MIGTDGRTDEREDKKIFSLAFITKLKLNHSPSAPGAALL